MYTYKSIHAYILCIYPIDFRLKVNDQKYDLNQIFSLESFNASHFTNIRMIYSSGEIIDSLIGLMHPLRVNKIDAMQLRGFSLKS